MWIRTIIAKDVAAFRLILAVKVASGALGLLSFALECVGPEVGGTGDAEKATTLHENPVLTANIYSRWVRSNSGF